MKKCILFCLYVITGLSLGLLTQSCKETPPEPPKPPTLTLTAEDASCTEAWLKVSCTELPVTIRLLMLTPPTQTRQTIRLVTADTLLIDEGLLPKHTYTYQLQRLGADSSVIETSASVQLTTMDTTSHSFQFSIDTLGVTSSVLYDVAIISENNVWAVGEIFLNDTATGQLDPRRYNAAHWDGNNWTALRVPYYYQGQPYHNPIQAVFAFGPDDIWFAGNGVIRWNGQQYIPMEIPTSVWGPNRINKIWGSSGNDLYIVGDAGSIAHYNSGAWQRVESGTTLPIMDVYGARNSRSGVYEILCVSADPNIPGHSQVLAIENTMAREIATNPLWEPWGIWFVSQRWYIIAGDGLWETHSPRGTWVRNNSIPPLFKTSICGKGLNDVIVCGAFLLLAHWNGINWQTFFPRAASSGFVGVEMKDNVMVAVGGTGNRAVAVQGRR